MHAPPCSGRLALWPGQTRATEAHSPPGYQPDGHSTMSEIALAWRLAGSAVRCPEVAGGSILAHGTLGKAT
eukprot:15217611-Alexandrium_andersonii.AAC.1